MVEVACLRRMKYGRPREQLEHMQLDLGSGQLMQPVVPPEARADDTDGKQHS